MAGYAGFGGATPPAAPAAMRTSSIESHVLPTASGGTGPVHGGYEGVAPPSAPAAMRDGSTSSGQLFRTANSVQWRPNGQGTSQMVAQNINNGYSDRPRGHVAYGTGLTGNWYV